jgi:hypothetical protein
MLPSLPQYLRSAQQVLCLPLLAAAVFLSPLGEFQQRRTQCSSIGGERVFGAKNGLLKNPPLDQSLSFKLPQLRGEDLLGRFRDAALQLAEAPAAILEFTKDQRLPLARDDTQGVRYRALLAQHAIQSITQRAKK